MTRRKSPTKNELRRRHDEPTRGERDRSLKPREPDEERLERVRELVEKLKQDAAEGATIIVEGKRDAEALRTLGVNGTILRAKSTRLSIQDFTERIDATEKVVILTDFDEAGEKVARLLSKSLEHRKAKVDLNYRRQLSALTRGLSKDVEGLTQHVPKSATTTTQGRENEPEEPQNAPPKGATRQTKRAEPGPPEKRRETANSTY